MHNGPQVPACEELHKTKYRLPNETFDEAMARVAATLMDNEVHRQQLRDILTTQRFLPAGRIQNAVGSSRATTAFNCFVSGTIEDSMDSIMARANEAAETMRRGGGIGYDFSGIRPRGDRIISLGSTASGPVSFMGIFNSVCETIMSAGHRRGAMMGCLRVDHPDIEEFVRAKQNTTDLTNFNVSVLVTDAFMDAVIKDAEYDLVFDGRVYDTIRAVPLWNSIMRMNWDWAEPGVLFYDTINRMNPLNHIEFITATNPCGEQPLPPYGACLLGSFNLVKYIDPSKNTLSFNFPLLKRDIPSVVRAMDNVIESTSYPLEAQMVEAYNKRRMGLGITGLANAFTMLGMRYGDKASVKFTKKVMRTILYGALTESALLAKEKGKAPAWDKNWLDTEFALTLPGRLQGLIKKHGLRNTHLTSVAPAGTISFTADNVSSGCEPVFAHEVNRQVNTEYGIATVPLKDYVWNYYGIKAETTKDLTTDDHLAIQMAIQPYVDSSVSKTINVGDNVTFDEFKDIYMKAWKGGLKGCTTFRLSGKRYGIMEEVKDAEQEDSTSTKEGLACYIDPTTGNKECD